MFRVRRHRGLDAISSGERPDRVRGVQGERSGPGQHLISEAPGIAWRVLLPGRVVAPRPAAAVLAPQLWPDIIQRHARQWPVRMGGADHPERHPDRSLAAFGGDPGVTLGFKGGDGAGVGHAGRIAGAARQCSRR